MESEWDALRVLGAITAMCLLLWVTWGVGYTVYVYLLPQVRRGNSWLRAHGAWAVVTGATSGIGKAYSHELARRGLNIVLISRDLSKLQQEAKEIERLHGKSTRVIQVDFTGGLEIYEAIEAGLKDLEIGVLVNNVGMRYARGLGKLLDCEDIAKELFNIINCNMMSVAQMTRIVLPQMVTRGKGIIINISSMADKRPYPFAAMYAATKAFVRSFSTAVGREYHSEGVIMQTVSPFLIETNMTYPMKRGLLVMTPEDFARQALDTLGLTSQTPGCLRHAVQGCLLSILLPSWFFLSSWQFMFVSRLERWSRAQLLGKRT
ncbi:very-long-chain 3-oxoacyl-CoA reductase-B-like isoform X2 [Hippopotamus amphibius kiboko]|uniref:very-long-chain 3-oxoacyl-CoA reductase-B-like isoform X2 n=1 Tax=Hippopotamus amphibius kiboko TaxID=575201 RepID=UPI002596D708|nr:very-long-chain 3-oxoacyl-CoA reductase-B-like isoform X2 [Hippopotamus amphibius kiboko]